MDSSDKDFKIGTLCEPIPPIDLKRARRLLVPPRPGILGRIRKGLTEAIVRRKFGGKVGISALAYDRERKGYDSIWVPDHLMGVWPQSLWTQEITSAASTLPSPHSLTETVTSMALAVKGTKRSIIGCSVTDPLRRHPAIIAQSIATLDLVSGGRCILGMGCGEGMTIKPYGIDHSKHAEKLGEAVRLIRAL